MVRHQPSAPPLSAAERTDLFECLDESMVEERATHLEALRAAQDPTSSKEQVAALMRRAWHATETLMYNVEVVGYTQRDWLQPKITELLDACPDLSHLLLRAQLEPFAEPTVTLLHPSVAHKDFTAAQTLVVGMPTAAWWVFMDVRDMDLASHGPTREQFWRLDRAGVLASDTPPEVDLTVYEASLDAEP